MERCSKKILIWVTAVLLAVALLFGGGAVYLLDYYHADMDEIAAFTAEMNVAKTLLSERKTAYGDAESSVGLIFYPGGKVEAEAYEPLLCCLASRGIFCVLVTMPFRLAVLDVDAAEGIREAYPHVSRWYMGGHSLGGSMAAVYLETHADAFDGLVLLGSYSTADLSETTLSVLSLFGSEDGVMNREKYSQYKKNLPSDFTETVIEGGCHAYFGMYGTQEGDGSPSLTAKEQIRMAADSISDHLLKGET